MDETREDREREKAEREEHARRLRQLLREQMSRIPSRVMNGSVDLAREFKLWAVRARRACDGKNVDTLQKCVSDYVRMERGE